MLKTTRVSGHAKNRRARRLISMTGVVASAWIMLLPMAAIALVSSTPSPSDSPDHPIGAFGRVNDVAVIGTTAYIGGDFSSVGGASRANLAAIDLASGQVTSWNPGTNAIVNEIEPSPDGSTLYVGGAFTNVAGQGRNRVAAINPTTGNVTGWDPGASGEVRDIAVTADTVFVGGAFGSIGGTGVSFVAAVDPATGLVDPSWNPSPNTSVNAVDLSPNGSVLYIGGDFDFVDGLSRPHVAAVTVAGGAVTGWATTTPHRVLDIDTSVNGALVYVAVGGPFVEGGNLATAYSAATGGAPIWSRQADGDFQAVTVATDAVYWGGHFVWSEGTYFNSLMALEPGTGEVLNWAPGANSGFGVWSLTYAANRLLVGGDFTMTGGITQPHFAIYEEDGPLGSAPPVAEYTWNCAQLDCDFDGSASFDTNGTVDDHSWDFGDGSNASGVAPSHSFPATGSYSVDLTVTDSDGLTDTVAHVVNVSDQVGTGIDFVAGASASDNATEVEIGLPTATAPGDAMLLFASANGNDMTIATPAGWTHISTVTSSTMTTSAFSRVAQPGDAGSNVTVSMNDRQKLDVAVAVYTGTDQANPIMTFAALGQTSVETGHTTPLVTTNTNGARIVSYWANKTSGATQWTAPPGELVRIASYGSGSGRITALLTDPDSDVGAGVHGGLTAITNDDGSKATMWTVALAPSAPAGNEAPTAAFTSSCSDLGCTFDATSSSDDDGFITDWDWNFGDTTTATGETTSHTYTTAGTYTVTLTVTDNDGATDTTTNPVTVTDPPTGTPISFRAMAAEEANASSVTVTTPAAVQAGDALLLFVSLNNGGTGVTVPSGWTAVGTQVDQSMQTRVYVRTAEAGDAGATVTVNLASRKKTSVILAAYDGTNPSSPVAGFASAPESGSTAAHVTPTAASSSDGAWVVSYWADKSSSTTSWTAPTAFNERYQAAMSGGGRIGVLLGDQGPMGPGTYGGLVGTSNAAAGKATMWTIVLAPGG